MKILKNPYFYFPFILFSVNQISEKAFNFYIPFVHAYLDDLLCMPVLLSISLILLRLILKMPDLSLTVKQTVFSFVYLSVVFEIILPLYSAKYTADPFDVIAYGIGAVIFQLKINNRKINSPKVFSEAGKLPL
jgi:hypothetical protein